MPRNYISDIRSLRGMNIPNLRSLELGENKILEISWLSELEAPHLQKIYMDNLN